MRRVVVLLEKSPAHSLLLTWCNEFIESSLAARCFCGIRSVGALCQSRPHQRGLDCGFLGLKCVYHNYLTLYSQPLDRQGCRFESTQSKCSTSPFFPLKKLKGCFRSELILGVNTLTWCEWPQRDSSVWSQTLPSSLPRSGTSVGWVKTSGPSC